MGFLDKFTKLSPDAQRLVDLKTKKIKLEANAIGEQARTMRDRQIAEIQTESNARIAPIEQRMEERRRETLDHGRKTLLGMHCMSLEMGLSSTLFRAVAPEQMANRKGARNTIETEVNGKVNVLKNNPSRENLNDIEMWAQERVRGNQQTMEQVKGIFTDFAQKLRQDGIALE